MGRDIHLPIGEDVLKAKKANCERRVKPVHQIIYTDILDLPDTQLLAGIRLVSEAAKCRQ